MTKPATALAAAIATLTISGVSNGAPYVAIEAVNDYSQCNGVTLQNAVASAANFQGCRSFAAV